MSNLPTGAVGVHGHRPAPIRALLSGLIDYAGLFPPAGLGMADTVRNYVGYQRGQDAWALARLVVPVARLQEFETAFAGLAEAEGPGARVPLTALLGPDPVADMAAVCTFNERHVHGGPRILSLESRATTPDQVGWLRAVVPVEYELFCELPLAGDLTSLVGQVESVGASAKVRTGGVTPGEIPAPEAVLGFLSACATEGVAFKATAGLHHAIRGEQALTSAAEGARGVLFGYLNVILAATVLWHERPTEEALRLLTLTRTAPLLIEEGGLAWDGIGVTLQEIDQARQEFIRAIGSCSFTEPLAEAPGA